MNRVCFSLRLVTLLLSSLILSSLAIAQTSFGRISGTVTDPAGAIIAAATVEVKNVGTQAVRTTKSDGNGFYSFSDLPIGTYSVDVNQTGFRRQQRTNLEIVADARLTVNFQMQLGDVTQTVDVTAQAGEALNTTSGELSHVIDTKQVQNLALNGRNYTQLMTMVPGAVVTNPDQFSVTTSLSATNQSLNGNRSDTNNLTVDGAYNSVAGSNGSLVNNVSSEFIQEVKLQTSNASAEYGRFSGAAFNIVTKNGTNDFHGAAFEYFRNDILDNADLFFAPNKTELRFNDFGYDLGGPILKNKFFFFVGEEWKRLRQQQTPTRLTVPSAAQLAGNFGNTRIIDPTTKLAFPGNQIPTARITPDGQAIANVYQILSSEAASYNPNGGANNLTEAPANPLDFREDIVRLDYSINEKHMLYGRWVQDSNELLDPFGTFAAGGNLPTTPTLRSRPGESFLASETWLPTPHIVNEAHANATWVSQHIPPTGINWLRSTFGFQFQRLFNGGTYPNGIPQVSITGLAGFQGPNFSLMSPTTDMQFADTLSVTLGSHLIKAGVMVARDE